VIPLSTLVHMTEPRSRTQVADPTGQTVAANVRRIRERRGLSTYDVSKALSRAGRPIAASAIAKVERAERRVDVGDLTALAAVLHVNPSALLLPPSDAPTDTTHVTGAGAVGADTAWDWADGKRPLVISDSDPSADLLRFELDARPARRRNELKTPEHLTRAAADLIAELARDGRSGLVVNPRHLLEEEARRREQGESDG